LATIWNALPDTDYGRIVKLLVLTGQRREEIGGLHWSEIDLDKRMISLPAVAHQEQAAPRHSAVRFRPRSPLGMPAPRRRPRVRRQRQEPFQRFALAKRALDKAIGIAPWFLHDVRRTVATKLGEELAVQPHIVKQS